jgi:arylformamidase
MAIYDISVPISPRLPVWPGDPAVEVTRIADVNVGDASNVSRLRMSTHAGTHVDPPFHFLPDGETVDELALDVLLGPAWVADCRGVEEVTAEVLEAAAIPSGTIRLLLLTDNSALWNDPHHAFQRRFVDVAASGAVWMVERSIRLVGVDYASVDGFGDDGFPAHRVLLPNAVIILENLDLRHVPPNRAYELLCLPLKITGGDGAPARVVLRDGVWNWMEKSVKGWTN